MGFSLDAADMTQLTSYIFSGAKSLVIRSKKNGKYIFIEKDDNGDEVFENVQSNKNIYLMKIAYVKDRKVPYKEYLKDWFQCVQKLKKKAFLRVQN